MLGGYYLGQLYLGESGILKPESCAINNSYHFISSDNIDLLQKHVIDINGSTHTIYSDNIDINQTTQLLINSAIHYISSSNILLNQHHYISTVSDTLHRQKPESIIRIFNWDDLNVFSGIYKKDRYGGGALDAYNSQNGIYKPKRGSDGDIVQNEDIDSGFYKKNNNDKGIL